MHTNQVVCKSHVSSMPFDFRLWTPSWCEWQVPRYHAIVCWWHGNKPMFCGKQIDGLARLSSFPHPIELLSGIQNCDTYICLDHWAGLMRWMLIIWSCWAMKSCYYDYRYSQYLRSFIKRLNALHWSVITSSYTWELQSVIFTFS